MGMRPPSLYSHFESKNAIYDAMFAESWRLLYETYGVDTARGSERKVLLREAELYFDFAASDLARHQLMSQAIIPDFTPSETAYAESLRAYDRMRQSMQAKGVRSQVDLDLWTALLSGAVNQQLANDPDGARWRRQLPRLVDMFCDDVGIAGPPLRRTK